MQYTLKNGCAEGILDTMGGELISYKNDGKEYLWTGDAAYWTGHAPVLFPFVSALKNGSYKFNGQEYVSKGKHGFARKSEFKLEELTDSSATFSLSANEVTLAQYPYQFKLSVKHEISSCGFKTTYKVANTDNKPMRFCIGGHPGFLIDGSVENYKLVFEKPEDTDLYYTDADSLFADSYKIAKRLSGTEFGLCYDDYDVDAIIARDVNSRSVKLIHKETGKGIAFDFTGFPVLVLWTPPKKKAPFICLEPWLGLPAYTAESGEFSEKPYAVSLDPGKEFEIGYAVSVL